jgi:glutathione S-transferase
MEHVEPLHRHQAVAPLQFESGAILLYLSEKYGPAATLQQRARTAAWTHFANATMCPIVFAEEFRKMHAAEVGGRAAPRPCPAPL